MSNTDVVDLDASAFASRIGTNYGATDDEAEQLKELLSAPTAELGKLQEEIDRVSAQLDELYSKHRALFRKIDAHRALLSPIRRMPVDIIQEIFLRCLPTQHNPIMSRYDSPMLLTQVCSSWRHIAHSTPLLWSAIHIVVPCKISNAHFYPVSSPWVAPASQVSSSLEAAQKRVAGITQWLDRAAECPLHIMVYDRDRPPSGSEYDIILTAIIAFSRRWQTIHFQSPSDCLSRVTTLSEHDVPMLESLTIRGRDVPPSQFHHGMGQDEVPEFKFLIDSGLLRAPRLRQIEYTRVTEDFLQFPLIWEQLTVISLTGFAWTAPHHLSLGNVARILQRCPALVKCTLEIAYIPPASGDYLENISIQPISLIFLETISLQSGRADLTLLFQALEVPALRELDFFINPANFMSEATFTGNVISFLKRTSATLQALTMDPFFLNKESLHTCLRHCPGLRSLSLRQSHFPGNEVWTPPPQHTGLHGDDPPVFTIDDDLLTSFIDDMDPLLEDLESFECTVEAALTDDALLSFIQTKRSGSARAPLKKIAVALRRPQVLPMASELKQYVKDGLDCRLSYLPPFTQGPYPASDGIFTDFLGGPYRPYTWGVLSFDDGDTDTE